MMPSNYILRNCKGVYKFTTLQETVNHLIYIDYIKIFVKNEKWVETLIQIVRIYSQNIGMGFGIEQCPMLIIKKKLKKLSIKTLQEKKMQIPGNIRSGYHQTNGDERKSKKGVPQKNVKICWKKTLWQKSN